MNEWLRFFWELFYLVYSETHIALWAAIWWLWHRQNEPPAAPRRRDWGRHEQVVDDYNDHNFDRRRQ